MLNNAKARFYFLLFRVYFIFFRFKSLNFDFKSSHSSFYAMTVCLICVFCTKERLNCTRNKMVLGKPPKTDSARLGHIPSLPWKLQLPLKPYFSLHPPDFKGNCNFVRFSLRFLLYAIKTSVKGDSLSPVFRGCLALLSLRDISPHCGESSPSAKLSQLDRSSPTAL